MNFGVHSIQTQALLPRTLRVYDYTNDKDCSTAYEVLQRMSLWDRMRPVSEDAYKKRILEHWDRWHALDMTMHCIVENWIRRGYKSDSTARSLFMNGKHKQLIRRYICRLCNIEMPRHLRHLQ